MTEYQLAIENAIAEDWELVKDTAGKVNTAAEIFPLAYRFGWHAARKHVGYTSADERIRQLEQLNAALAAEVDAQRPVIEAATAIATRLRDLRSPVDDEERLINTVTAYEARKAK